MNTNKPNKGKKRYFCGMEKKIREVKTYLHYFDDFFVLQKPNVQRKITFVLDYIENKEGLIPEKFLKHIQGSKGLYEVRVEVGSDILESFPFLMKAN